MRDFCICMLAFCVLVLAIGHCIQSVEITNLRQSIKHTEQGYQAVIEENKKLQRINEQNLQLIAEGGWYDVVSTGTGD